MGTVIAQSPDANFFVRRSGTVDLTVSQGIERGQVPSGVGLQQAEVEADLALVKLAAGGPAAGRLAPRAGPRRCHPLPARSCRSGPRSSVVVASGNVPVPDVRRLTVEVAVATLDASTFGIGIEYVDATEPPNTVLDQQPFSGVLPQGSDVVLRVARQPGATPTPDPAATTSPQASATPDALTPL